MKYIPMSLIVLASASILSAPGCGRVSPEGVSGGSAGAIPEALALVFGPVSASEEMAAIPELRTRAQPGDEVIFEATVAGTKHPFVENRAAFVVGDEKTVVTCNMGQEGEGCSTAWDTCSDEPEKIRAGTATIQVVDEAGAVLRHGVRGVHGLRELSRVRVAGIVTPQSTPEAFVINAKRIQIL